MSDVKLMRKQLRNVVQEQLSEVMEGELLVSLCKRLDERIDIRLKALEDHVKQALANIDSRSKDVQDLIVRQVMAAKAPPVEGENEKV